MQMTYGGTIPPQDTKRSRKREGQSVSQENELCFPPAAEMTSGNVGFSKGRLRRDHRHQQRDADCVLTRNLLVGSETGQAKRLKHIESLKHRDSVRVMGGLMVAFKVEVISVVLTYTHAHTVPNTHEKLCVYMYV